VPETQPSKTELLADIEALIAYGKEEPTINPDLLKYLTVDDLQSIKARLLERVGKLNEEDKAWLMRFKRNENG